MFAEILIQKWNKFQWWCDGQVYDAFVLKTWIQFVKLGLIWLFSSKWNRFCLFTSRSHFIHSYIVDGSHYFNTSKSIAKWIQETMAEKWSKQRENGRSYSKLVIWYALNPKNIANSHNKSSKIHWKCHIYRTHVVVTLGHMDVLCISSSLWASSSAVRNTHCDNNLCVLFSIIL